MRMAETVVTGTSAVSANRGSGLRARVLEPATVALALGGILLLGAFFRLTGVNWDGYTHLHPDERFITMVENALAWPSSLAEYFDTSRSPLNPYNRGFNSFVYGTFPLFLVKWLGMVLGMEGYDQIHLVGRVASALFDLGSVFVVFLIGRRLYGRAAGLIAAALSSATAIQVQQSHFFTFDTFAAFFLLVAFYFAVRLWQDPRWFDYPAMGAALGLAVASKVNSAVFLLVVALVALRQLQEVTARRSADRLNDWLSVLGRFAVAGLAALLVFRVAEPYAFSGPGFLNAGISTKFLNDMGFVQKLISGEVDQPPSVQWAGTPPYLFPLRNLVFWGMGLPFGLLGWLAVLVAAFRLLRKHETVHLLLVVWVAFFFFYQGSQFAKTMRYFVPVVPLLAVAAGWLLVWSHGQFRQRFPSRAAAFAVPAIGGLVLLATLAYAAAFASIYTRPVTRIEATEWIFANIPQGAAIANEHWDDPLPLRWKGRDAGWYQGTMLELYHEDGPDKLRKLVEQLDRTQYIFLSSNRLYGSIPRMPMRYPMTTEYYRALFSGELGFQLVRTFTSYPSLLGLELNDDGAEEIFSVYDHPKVLIFEKTAAYSPQRTREILSAVPLDRALPIRSVDAQYNALLESDDYRVVQESGGTWSRLYDRESLANRQPTLIWLLAVELLGLLAFPLAWRLFGGLRDRGYGIAKIGGLLAVSYVAWVLPSSRVLSFGPGAVLAGVAVLTTVSLVLLARHRTGMWRHVRGNLGLIAVQEAVVLGAFALFWLIRMRNPDLWHLNFGGEKPMEFAYLNAVAKSTFFPPYDPWLAGGYLNYYYFGYVMVASLIHVTGIVPAVAFNLAIPTAYALTAVGLFSVAFNLTSARTSADGVEPRRGYLAGLGAVVLVLIAGNLDGLVQIVEALWKLGGSQFRSSILALEGLVRAALGAWAVLAGGKTFPQFDFWRSTRLVPNESPAPIMEFPYFTFLYGDLHAHMLSMPVAVLALGLATAVVLQGRSGGTSDRVRMAVAGGLVVGALQATNSWDYPTYLLLIAAAFVIASFARDRALTLNGVVNALLYTALVFAVAQLLYWPFLRSYQLFYNGVELSKARTPVQYYLVMFGVYFFATTGVLATALLRSRWHRHWLRELLERYTGSARWDRRRQLNLLLVRPSPWVELMPLVVGPALAVAIASFLLQQYLVGILLLQCLLAFLALFDRERRPEMAMLAVLVALGALLTLGVEFVTIEGDIGRMNTVFKFYLQAWFLFGVASAVGAAMVLGARGRGDPDWLSGWRRGMLVAVGGLLAAALIYPVAATPVKVGMRFQQTPPTLDGMAYMRGATFKDQNKDIVLARDYAAIGWLQDNVIGSPVVLEAQVPEYHWGSRVSIYTGLPTILGWTWHQRQQRAGYGWMIDQRLRDVKAIYEGQDPAQAATLMAKYGVRLVYVGDLERAYYPASGLAKFDRMDGLSVVYRQEGVTIYEVARGGSPSVLQASAATTRG